MSHLEGQPAWLGEALATMVERVHDLVVVLDGRGQVRYLNPFGAEVLGFADPREAVGLGITQLLHPEDWERTIMATSRLIEDKTETKGRPVRFRLRRVDGSYLRVEANGALGTAVGAEPSLMAIVARQTTDADLHEHLMTRLTDGASSTETLALVPEFGLWRQPDLLSAVFARDDDGTPVAFGSAQLLALGGLDDEGAPWARPQRTGEELFVSLDELPIEPRRRAAAAGVTFLRARPVLDPLHGSWAIVVHAHGVPSPLPAERDTLAFSWYSLDKMAQVLDMAFAWRTQAIELRRAAATDPLTGLANRTALWTRARNLAGSGQARRAAALCIDLDGFKPINDTFGHGIGDSLLLLVADRLRSLVRRTDLVARVGGDEFTILVEDLADGDVAVLAARIVAQLAVPFAVAGNTIGVGASVGVAIVPELHDVEALLNAADRALYDAKHAGRGRWVRHG